MNTPKLLPWYARRAGVPVERAEVLWRQAVRAATDETGWVGNSEYWGAAMEHFRRLLKSERASLCALQNVALMRKQERLWRATIELFGDMCLLATRRWHRHLARGHRTA